MPSLAARPQRVHRRDVLSALRREEIVSAAIRVFGSKGFEVARAEEIAAAAGVAKGTLYLYFRSKEAIYTAAVAEALRELQTKVDRETAEAKGFTEKLATAIRVRLNFWVSNEPIYRLLLTVGASAPHRRQTNAWLRAGQKGLLAIFAEGVRAGEIADEEYAPLAWAALDMVRGAAQRRVDRLCARLPEQDAAWITACVLAQVKGVRAGQTPSPRPHRIKRRSGS